MVHNHQNPLQERTPARFGLLSSLFLISLLGCYGFQFFSDEPKWETYKQDDFGFSFDCPYHMDFNLQENKDKKGNHTKSISGFAGRRSSIFEFMTSSFQKKFPGMITFTILSIADDKHGPPLSLKKHVESAKQLESWPTKNSSYKNFTTKIEHKKCSGIPAALLTITFDVYDKSGNWVFTHHEIELIVVRGRQFWTVAVEYYGDKKDYDEMANRMINSFKIIPQTIPVPKNMATS